MRPSAATAGPAAPAIPATTAPSTRQKWPSASRKTRQIRCSSRWPRRLLQRHQPDCRARDDPDRARPAGGRRPRWTIRQRPRSSSPAAFRARSTRPALDPALMYDMRDPDLQAQASGAIDRHAQADHRADGGAARGDCGLPADRQPLLFEQGVEVVRPGWAGADVAARDTRRQRSAAGSSSWMRRGIRPARRVCAPSVTAGRC